MNTINITLPDSLHEFVEFQAKTGDFADAADYVQSLIDSAYRSTIESKLREAHAEYERGDGRDMVRSDWERLKSDYKKRHNISE